MAESSAGKHEYGGQRKISEIMGTFGLLYFAIVTARSRLAHVLQLNEQFIS
jgi:hypothetical protein